MAILNVHVVNANLADIRGGIGVGVDEGAWMTTAYLIAEIVAIPLTGWLAAVLSTRRYLLGSTALFLVFSAGCAYATNLGEMIAMRALQGLSGGVLIPVAFMLIVRLLPPAKLAIGMTLFSLAATIAPVIGPTVGGFLTDAFGWQSVFLLNIVPGAVVLTVLWGSLEREPMQLGLLRQGDWWGIATVTLGLGALQTVLQEGEKNDWLDSPFIVRLSVIAAISLALFVWIGLRAARPLVNLRLLGRRNLLGGVLASFLLGAASYGMVFIVPLYLSEVQGYSPAQIAVVMAWAGLTQFTATPLVPTLVRRFDGRVLIALGFCLFAAGSFMNATLTADVAGEQLLLPSIVCNIGAALIWTPLNTLAVSGIERENSGSAASLLAASCALGGAVGIAFFQTFLLRREYFHRRVISESVSLFDETTRRGVEELKRYFLDHGVTDQATAWRKAVAAIADRVHVQSYTMAFGDVFVMLSAILVVAAFAVVLLRKPAVVSVAAAH